MDYPQPSKARRARAYILEAAAAVVIVYWLFGSHWSPELWAISTVVIVAIVVIRVLFDAGAMSAREDSIWHLVFEFSFAASIFISGIWQKSLWIVGLGLFIGWVWLHDWQTHRKRFRPQAPSSEPDSETPP